MKVHFFSLAFIIGMHLGCYGKQEDPRRASSESSLKPLIFLLSGIGAGFVLAKWVFQKKEPAQEQPAERIQQPQEAPQQPQPIVPVHQSVHHPRLVALGAVHRRIRSEGGSAQASSSLPESAPRRQESVDLFESSNEGKELRNTLNTTEVGRSMIQAIVTKDEILLGKLLERDDIDPTMKEFLEDILTVLEETADVLVDIIKQAFPRIKKHYLKPKHHPKIPNYGQ